MFKPPGGTREISWSDTAYSLVNGAIERLTCEIEVTSGPGNERIQCSEVEYYDYQNNQTIRCQQNIPIEIRVNIQ